MRLQLKRKKKKPQAPEPSCSSGYPHDKKEVKLFADMSLMVWVWASFTRSLAKHSASTDKLLWEVTSLESESKD